MELLQKTNGTIIRTDLNANGVSPSALSSALDKGLIQRVTNGVYVEVGKFPDEYWYRQRKFSKGVFSHATALVLHDLTDLNPAYFAMTFPRNYHNKNLSKHYIKGFYIPENKLYLGTEQIKSPNGNELVVTSLERTLVDIWSPRYSFDQYLKLDALKRYLEMPNKKIYRIAILEKEFGKREELRKAMEVLL